MKEGIRALGHAMEFNTIAISDGETMGTEGMRASLVSREVIAIRLNWSAGDSCLTQCLRRWLDKTIRRERWHWPAEYSRPGVYAAPSHRKLQRQERHDSGCLRSSRR